jgi:hypothetical protein
VPGHPVKVVVYGSEELEAIKNDLVFRSYRDVYVNDSNSKVIVK